jgi:hypothetical protein
MKITVPPLELEEFEGFTQEKDIFGFQNYAKNFTNLILNTDDPLVVGFSGEWGTGKTTFIKMWRGMLKHEVQVPSIYFDAFQNDYISDAFLAIAGELYSALDQGEQKKEKFRKKIAPVVRTLGLASLGLGIKAVTSGFIDINASETMAEAVKDSAEHIFKKQLDTLSDEKSAITDFRKFLKEKSTELFQGKKLIFIIDELDRCKPTFALDLLEKIKHIFSVQNIVFVLVMNQTQMQKIICTRYGGTDQGANLYLQKFIHIWASLPKTYPDSFDQHKYQKRYLEHCLKKMGYRFNNINSPAIYIFDKLIEHYDMSFRDIERALTNFAILDNTLFSEIESFRVLCVFISVIKDRFPEVYHKLLINRMTYDELIKEINLNDFEKVDDSIINQDKKKHFLWLLKYTLASEKEEPKMQIPTPKSLLYSGGEKRESLPKILNCINNFSK